MAGSMVSFACKGEQYEGYLAQAATGSGVGVVVLQEWWGLVGHIKDVVDRFAAEGFTALAPDLYRGKTTTEPDEAGSLMMALNIGETEEALACAVERVLVDPACSSKKAGVVGFCMGGQLSLLAATTNPNIGACVDYYGIHPSVQPDFSKLEAPILGFFAENDAYASPAAVQALSEQLSKLGKGYEFHTYPETNHAFFNSDRPEVYGREVAEDSWRRMVGFFQAELG